MGSPGFGPFQSHETRITSRLSSTCSVTEYVSAESTDKAGRTRRERTRRAGTRPPGRVAGLPLGWRGRNALAGFWPALRGQSQPRVAPASRPRSTRVGGVFLLVSSRGFRSIAGAGCRLAVAYAPVKRPHFGLPLATTWPHIGHPNRQEWRDETPRQAWSIAERPIA